MATYNERLLTELNNLRKNRGFKFYAHPEQKKGDLNLKIWECGFPGTELYDGAYFKLKLFFTENFPFKPPAVQFLTPVFHPNIYINGAVCLDLLGSKWKPELTINNILYALQQLLNNPNTNSPANSEASDCYKKDLNIYEERTKENIKLNHTIGKWFK